MTQRADMAIAQLNNVLQEVNIWCLNNQLTPHPGKSEAMLLNTGNPMGQIASVSIGGSNLRWVTKTLLLSPGQTESQVDAS